MDEKQSTPGTAVCVHLLQAGDVLNNLCDLRFTLTAYGKCRECLASNVDIQKCFLALQFSVRDEDVHSKIVRWLKASSSVSKHLSVKYGVN